MALDQDPREGGRYSAPIPFPGTRPGALPSGWQARADIVAQQQNLGLYLLAADAVGGSGKSLLFALLGHPQQPRLPEDLQDVRDCLTVLTTLRGAANRAQGAELQQLPPAWRPWAERWDEFAMLLEDDATRHGAFALLRQVRAGTDGHR